MNQAARCSVQHSVANTGKRRASRDVGRAGSLPGGAVEFLSVSTGSVDMPRASWKGFLRLSLVSCPVYLSPATSRSPSGCTRSGCLAIEPQNQSRKRKTSYRGAAALRHVTTTIRIRAGRARGRGAGGADCSTAGRSRIRRTRRARRSCEGLRVRARAACDVHPG